METSNIFQSVEKSRLSDDIARQIEQAIREGRLVAGQALPSERELTQQFNVSRPILREALRILEIQGLVSTQQGRGTFIKDPGTDILHVNISDWLEKNIQLVNDFYEARLAIEPVCAALASQRATSRQIKDLKMILELAERVLDKSEKPSNYIAYDIDFHSAIARMSGNSFLIQMLDTLIVPETDIRKIVLRLPNRISDAHQGHLNVVRAIESRKPEAARSAMIKALKGPIDAIQEFMGRRNQNP